MTVDHTADVTDVEDETAVDESTLAEAEDELSAEESPQEHRDGAVALLLRSARRKWAAILLVLLLVASAALAAWLYVFQFRADQQTDSAAAKVAITAASEGTVALLSYAPGEPGYGLRDGQVASDRRFLESTTPSSPIRSSRRPPSRKR